MAHHHISGWAVFIIIILILAALAFAGWVVWSRRRAARLGLAPPSLNPFSRGTSGPASPTPRAGGVVGWVNDKIRAFKNRRYAAGAYEEGRGGGAGGAVPGSRLDPDEAWDSHVGNEAYYEEQELGLHAPTAYGGSGYGAPPAAAAPPHSPYAPDAGHLQQQHLEEERGRSRTRDLGPPGHEEDARAKTPVSSHTNPFGDNAEPSNMSLRGVSPRPLDMEAATKHQQQHHDRSADNSPTERRSMFREEM